jgi:hypothetical protein
MSRWLLGGFVYGLVLGSPALVRADDAEEKAVKFVKQMDGSITRDDKRPGQPVVKVSLWGAEVTGAELKQLTAFKSLTTLDLSCSSVTDTGLKEVAALKDLTALNLAATVKVTDAGVKELAALKNLTSLNLGSAVKVTDAGVKELAALKNLTTLNLRRTKVTDEAVRELQKALPGCKITKD